MTREVRTGTAFRSRPGITTSSSDLIRLRREGDVHLGIIANGCEGAFSACWPLGSRLLLDLFDEAWASTSGHFSDRLPTAFTLASKRFTAKGTTFVPDVSDDWDNPAATLIAVATDGHTAEAAWIGADTAMLIRGSRTIRETIGHTLRERFRVERPGFALDQLPNVIVRSIGPAARDEDPPTLETFEINEGDTVAVVARAALRGAGVSASEAGSASALNTSPDALAEQLASLAFAGEACPYSAVAVFRFGSPTTD